jgi:hypothetical protein
MGEDIVRGRCGGMQCRAQVDGRAPGPRLRIVAAFVVVEQMRGGLLAVLQRCCTSVLHLHRHRTCSLGQRVNVQRKRRTVSGLGLARRARVAEGGAE